MDTKIKEIAKQVRAAFEEISNNDDLCGFCGRASIQIHLAALRQGLKGVTLCVGVGHMYCMANDTVIDVTATQFGVEDKVLIVPLFDIPSKVKSFSPWSQQGRYSSIAQLEAENCMWSSKEDTDRDRLVVMRHTGESVTDEELIA
jgi:hypothetical protein